MANSKKRPLIALAIVGCAIFAWNYTTLQRSANEVLTNDSRNEGVKVFAHYKFFVNPGVVVFDLREISGENSPIDVTRTLLQFAEKQKNRNFNRVVLSFRGTPKFELKGDYFHTIGNEYESQNPVYILRTFPENVYELDGSPAFGTWSGGLIGVVGKQMEDLNDLHKRWYLSDFANGS